MSIELDRLGGGGVAAFMLSASTSPKGAINSCRLLAW
jgi:hypothetical protein